MTPKPINLIALALMLALMLCGAAGAEPVRQPVRAGSFYPSDPRELRNLIDRLAQNAQSTQPDVPDRRSLRALILPHAGYPYSGPTAAHAARVLSENQFKTVLLMGPDHFVGFRSAAVPAVQAFQTPLGKIELHPAVTDLLKQPELFVPLPPADDREHSLEVVLPFLQAFLKSFQLIPVVVGRADVDRLATALLPWVDRETLVVVSSDLSHFLPYAEAHAKDRKTIDAILARDRRVLVQDANSACGAHALAILLAMADRFGWRPVLLNYLNSGDTAGDRTRVVGYAAIAFFGDPPMPAMQEANQLLTPEKGQVLVQLARSTLMEKFGRPLPPSEADRMRSALSDASFQVPQRHVRNAQTQGPAQGLHRQPVRFRSPGRRRPPQCRQRGLPRPAVRAAHGKRTRPGRDRSQCALRAPAARVQRPGGSAAEAASECRRGDHPPRACQRDLSAPGLGAASEKRGFFRPPLPQSRAAPGRLETRQTRGVDLPGPIL